MTGQQRDKNFHYCTQAKNDLHLMAKMIKADLEVMDDTITSHAFHYLCPNKYQNVVEHLQEIYEEADYSEEKNA